MMRHSFSSPKLSNSLFLQNKLENVVKDPLKLASQYTERNKQVLELSPDQDEMDVNELASN